MSIVRKYDHRINVFRMRRMVIIVGEKVSRHKKRRRCNDNSRIPKRPCRLPSNELRPESTRRKASEYLRRQMKPKRAFSDPASNCELLVSIKRMTSCAESAYAPFRRGALNLLGGIWPKSQQIITKNDWNDNPECRRVDDDDDDLWFSDVLLTMNMDVDWRLK